MRTHVLRTAVAGAVAALALLLLGGPAAGAPTDLTIDGGTASITGTDLSVSFGDEPEANPCENPWFAPVVHADVAGPPPTSVTVTGLDFPKVTLQAGTGEWYQADLSLVDAPPFTDNSGSVAVGGAWTQGMYLAVDIYLLGGDEQGPATCNKTELVCSAGAQLSLSGTYPGGPVAGSGLIDVFFCPEATIAGQITGQSITVAGLTFA